MSGRARVLVPAGTERQVCRSCFAAVYWIVTAKGNRMPVDCAEREGGLAPTASKDGRGISHFATCPDAGKWRGRKGVKSQ